MQKHMTKPEPKLVERIDRDAIMNIVKIIKQSGGSVRGETREHAQTTIERQV